MSKQFFKEYFECINTSIQSVNHVYLVQAAEKIISVSQNGRKLIIAGNGGSAAIASHVSIDFTKAAKIRAINFNEADLLTCFANDYGYDKVFERQVQANAVKEDVVVAISTSGNSPNVINAINEANKIGIKTIGLTGKQGGQMTEICDVSIIVPSDNTPRIQETHIAIIHILCELLDRAMEKNV